MRTMSSEQQRKKAIYLGILRRQAMWERIIKADALRQAGWRIPAVAGAMDVSKSTAYRWMQMLDRTS